MKPRFITFLTLTLLIVSALAGLSLLPTPASGSGLAQLDPTQQQQTIDAVVNGYFTQTAQAQQQIAVTQTIQAAFDQALTATAGFQATVDAQFGAALTATAGFQATVNAQFGAALTATAQSGCSHRSQHCRPDRVYIATRWEP